MIRRAQSGIEYLILVSFVSFVIIALMGLAYTLLSSSEDQLRLRQAELFCESVVSVSESVFFSGVPTKSREELYLPAGVTSLNLTSEGLILEMDLSTGTLVRLFSSDVPLSGTIDPFEGNHALSIEARVNDAFIQEL